MHFFKLLTIDFIIQRIYNIDIVQKYEIHFNEISWRLINYNIIIYYYKSQ